MRKTLAAIAALATMLASPALTAHADAAQPLGSAPIPAGPAPNWLIADLDSGQILAEQNGYAATPPASTIKVLLALVVLDELNLDDAVVATPADTQVECNCVGVKAGHSYTARDLLEGLLLVSGNDAANALADMLGGPEAAVAKMNAKASEVGATDTHASTPSGLDGPGGPGTTTPHDLAAIFRAAMANPVFAEITAQPAATFPTDSGERPIVNMNELLARYPGAFGGKTGFTDAARKTYVGGAARDGRRLVVAMMYGLIREGGPNYWDQASALLDWGFAQGPTSGVGSL
ncbi:D-alanyl-D-alanine carboxypeptidase [Mycolicibacter heraklionensis]|uniref:D-alanyl-D-alanine carboxypeptidase n=1 Tax=Mycolicibacter heraklionensis TaxID=512402 RepID=A0ABR5FF27_9MYCO|nr:serine hydrolase [Mycolicibacter heraklionensis]KLO28716.1 D-alanyl-D-alanine carboxypeptidase [Mycolicibacter heraklionensis]